MLYSFIMITLILKLPYFICRTFVMRKTSVVNCCFEATLFLEMVCGTGLSCKRPVPSFFFVSYFVCI